MPNQYSAQGAQWTEKRIREAKKVLAEHVQIATALPVLTKSLGFRVTDTSLRKAFSAHSAGSPNQYLGKKAPEPGENLKQLYVLTKKPIKFSELCDKLDMSPTRAKKLIEEAWGYGMALKVIQDHVGIESSVEDDRIQDVIAPVVGQRQHVGVISDTHLGSKYCLRQQLIEFVNYAYDRGVREILHPGDLVDGDYRHAKFEMTHMGLEEQTRDLYETLPKLKGLTYRCITGNHDQTFTDENGVNVGRYISNYFRERGRNDISFYGERSAFLRVRGAVFHLWHPRSGGAYALSYPLMKKIESYSVVKPQVLLAGHWHRFVTCYERGVHAIACPTFQAPGSAFSKSLASAPAIGGLILSYDLTKHGTMRSFVVEKRSYFEREKPIEIYNDTDAIPVEA